jgi:hypothetical protein
MGPRTDMKRYDQHSTQTADRGEQSHERYHHTAAMAPCPLARVDSGPGVVAPPFGSRSCLCAHAFQPFSVFS